MKYKPRDRNEVSDNPEQSLIAAVLERARMDCVGIRCRNGTKAARIRDEARDWFFFSRDVNIFSFLWCCDMLGLDPLAIRHTAAKLVAEITM